MLTQTTAKGKIQVKMMDNFEIILGCEVYSYEIKNDDIYGSKINEEMLARHRRAKELDRDLARFLPVAQRNENARRIA